MTALQGAITLFILFVTVILAVAIGNGWRWRIHEIKEIKNIKPDGWYDFEFEIWQKVNKRIELNELKRLALDDGIGENLFTWWNNTKEEITPTLDYHIRQEDIRRKKIKELEEEFQESAKKDDGFSITSIQ